MSACLRKAVLLGQIVWEGAELVRPEQTVSQMVEEVPKRQVKTLARQTGEPFEKAMSVTFKSDATQQLRALVVGAYCERKAEEWQARLPWVRAEERHYSWLESYMEWLEGKEERTQYHALLEEELASLRG
jgi:tRNA isopentenyl-2-thiomethyl-A-37 hydroxylase MiaE